METPPPPYLFNGFMRDYAITQVAADPYTGKTMLMLYMALCCDFHRPLFDQFAPLRNHKVLYIGPDSPDWDLGQQSRKLMLGMGIKRPEWRQTDIKVHIDQDINIVDPEFIKSVNELHAEFPFSVLFIDTLLDVHDFDPNSWQMMKQVMKVLKMMRDTYGCAIIFAHHTSKPTAVERPVVYAGGGSGKVVGSSDFQFLLRRKGTRVNLFFGKQRGQQADAPLEYYTMEDVEVDGEWGIKMVAPSNNRDTIALALLTKQPASRHDIAAELQRVITPPLTATQALKAADNAIQSLRTLGRIKQKSRGVWEVC